MESESSRKRANPRPGGAPDRRGAGSTACRSPSRMAILTKGLPTLAGSKLVDPNQAWAEDAPAVARLREEGAIILGKTTTPEFGWKGVTDSPLTGISRNPWDSGTHAGGLERRLGRCRGGGDWSRRRRNGCRRLGPHSRLLLRPRCAQGIARTHSHLSAKSARHDGSCWSDLPHNPGRELAACSHVASRPPRLERPAAGRAI